MVNKKVIISIFIIVVMVLSVLGFMLGNNEDSTITNNGLNYNNFKFARINEKYILDKNGKQYYFDYFPDELQNITVPSFTITSPKYYFIFTPGEKDINMEYSMQKLQYSLSQFNIMIVLACDSEENCPDIPIKDCNDYSFYFKRSENNTISFDENCIILEGDNQFLSQAVDKINYKLLGVL